MTDQKARMGDVARLSGLSRSTVDRVLNGRSGVRAQTVKKVEAAMRELGYAPSSLSARRMIKPQKLTLVLPQGTNPFFDWLMAGFDRAATSGIFAGAAFTVLRFDPYAPQTHVAALQKVKASCDAVITLGIDNPDTTRAINDLVAAGKRVITIVSDAPQSQRHAYVGQDNFAAGRTAARLMAAMVPPGDGAVALMVGHLQFRHLLDRMSGFRQVLGLARPELTLLQPPAYGSDPEMVERILAGLREQGDKLRGVYVAGGGQPNLIDAIATCEIGKIKAIGHEVTEAGRTALNEGRFQVLLAHDVDEVGRRAIEIATGLAEADQGLCPVQIFVQDNLPT